MRLLFALLVAACLIQQVAASDNENSKIYSDSGPDSQIADIVSMIKANRLNAALEKTDRLLAAYPNFRLANLIKGDLLLARSKALTSFGNASDGSNEAIKDLHEEALVRIKAYNDRAILNNRLPDSLIELPANIKTAIVVDTKNSRLYLFENTPTQPRLVGNYYFTQGKLGAGKTKEGDKKTPTGVYRVTSSLSTKQLGDFYGVGAYPINYPNAWDKANGRTGHGIWLHGTPTSTYSRPPKASDGCVVLTNPDLKTIASELQLGLTPVVITDGVNWRSSSEIKKERTEFTQRLNQWKTDWESLNAERFLRHYSKRFVADNADYALFSQQKRERHAKKQWIKVTVNNISILRSTGMQDIVSVTFDQTYQSNDSSDVMRKQQYWMRENNDWKIVFEGNA